MALGGDKRDNPDTKEKQCSHYATEHSHRTHSDLTATLKSLTPTCMWGLLKSTYKLHKTMSHNESKRSSRGAISQAEGRHGNQCRGLWKASQHLRKEEWQEAKTEPWNQGGKPLILPGQLLLFPNLDGSACPQQRNADLGHCSVSSKKRGTGLWMWAEST